MKLYRCDLCGRVFHEITPHICVHGNYRKRNLTFTEFEDVDCEYVKKSEVDVKEKSFPNIPQGALILEKPPKPKIEWMEDMSKDNESNFGKKNLIGRPLGVWCLTKDNKAVKPGDWKSEYEALGVGVITDKTAFIVLPTPQAALPFGSTSVEEYDDIVYDEETYDSVAATDCIDEAHSGVEGEVWGDDKHPFVGAPAAEYCLKQGGYLPTLATVKEIAANIKSINEAMLAIGGYVVCGWLWTSTVKKSNSRAFVVSTSSGIVYNDDRNFNHNARAVSAFHFENFEF